MSNPNRSDYFFINENDVDARELVIAEGIIKQIRGLLAGITNQFVIQSTINTLDVAAMVQEIRNESPFSKTGVAVTYRTAEEVAPPDFDSQQATVHVPMGGRPFTVPTEVAEEMNRLRAVILNKEMQLSGIRAKEEISRWPQWKQDIAGVMNQPIGDDQSCVHDDTQATAVEQLAAVSRLIDWCWENRAPVPYEIMDGARQAVAALGGAGGLNMWDAYEGARQDLLIWKRRALEAEDALRRLPVVTLGLNRAK